MKNKFSDYLGPLRAPFLLINISIVASGAGTAYWRTGSLNILDAILCLIGATLAHISVNSLNEYSDFRTGVDSHTIRTPFSGGSGTLQRVPSMASYALGVGLISALFTASIGMYFILARGWSILPLGLFGLAIVLLYTPWITRIPSLCLVAPGLGFGTCMVMGTDLVLGGNYSTAGFFASLVPFFLVSNLLLLNQFPDVEADRQAGRKNFVITRGLKVGATLYTLFIIGAYASITTAVVLNIFPRLALLALLTSPLAIRACVGAFRDGDNTAKLMPALGMNVVINLGTPALLAVGLFLSR